MSNEDMRNLKARNGVHGVNMGLAASASDLEAAAERKLVKLVGDEYKLTKGGIRYLRVLGCEVMKSRPRCGAPSQAVQS